MSQCPLTFRHCPADANEVASLSSLYLGEADHLLHNEFIVHVLYKEMSEWIPMEAML